MRDGFAGILNVFFMALFLVIVVATLGLVVCYTKAFKMKNSVISIIEQYEASKCFEPLGGSACVKRIQQEANNIGYGPKTLHCDLSSGGFDGKVGELFCYKKIISDSDKDRHISKHPVSYKIVTQVDLNLPLLSNIFGFNFFQVEGNTRVIETRE